MTDHAVDAPYDPPGAMRRLTVLRQDRDTRRFVVLGTLVAETDGTYTFSYQSDVALDPDFRPIPGLPDPSRTYRSSELFAFFTNRVMSARRPDYPAFLQSVGLAEDEATPAEMLVRTAGCRATDTYQVVPEPTVEPDGSESRLFLVAGDRHVPGAIERVGTLVQGQALALRPDPTNAFDPDALLLDVASGQPVGYVPGYLCKYVHTHRDAGADVRVTVVKANGPDVPRHPQLLCRLRVHRNG